MATADFSRIRGEFLAITDRARKVSDRLGPVLLTRRPAPDHWSAAECLLHLRITAEAYLPIWRDAIRRARNSGWQASTDPFRVDLWGRFFVWFIEPPPKVRFPAPKAFVPRLELE